jgi:hypothetical protein
LGQGAAPSGSEIGASSHFHSRPDAPRASCEGVLPLGCLPLFWKADLEELKLPYWLKGPSMVSPVDA